MNRSNAFHTRALARLVQAMALAAGLAMVAMMAITTADVIMRAGFNRPLRGAYDLVKICGGLALFLALPYTTAIKGHVAVEYFFHTLRRPGRLLVDSANRLISASLCAILARHAAKYGAAQKASGEVSLTLQLPEYPVAYLAAFAFAVAALVILHHLVHPDTELVRP